MWASHGSQRHGPRRVAVGFNSGFRKGQKHDVRVYYHFIVLLPLATELNRYDAKTA